MTSYTPTPDEQRVIDWLRRKADAYGLLGYMKEAFVLRESASCIARGEHRA